MIVFDLSCDQGHRFECWFRSSEDFASQNDRGLVVCAECGSTAVTKAPMAPAVPVKGNQRSEPAAMEKAPDRPLSGGSIPPEVQKAMQALAQAQAKALKESRYVGDGFAEESRAMHYGDKDLEAIHGKATLKEAKELLEEGVPLAPLLTPFTPPEDLN
ncbi:DUF1178 family protein [Altererythrobacter sp. MF3-039]|uniref:DUF1178 family protein n=1 Tax=Altererythrobacter sp. MF3-039 TaxID=3252901 RepID=UPI00390C74AE